MSPNYGRDPPHVADQDSPPVFTQIGLPAPRRARLPGRGSPGKNVGFILHSLLVKWAVR